jgi:hypothetical protein
MAKKKPVESVVGGYTAIPWAVLDSAAFQGLPHPAKSLLYEVMRQHNGRNNGHFQLTNSWLRQRGLKSNDTNQRAKLALLGSQLLIQTRWGGRNMNADRFALSWLPISDFTGLDIDRSTYRQGAWVLSNPVPVSKKQMNHSVSRDSTAPSHGIVPSPAAPSYGTKMGISEQPAIPPDGKDVYCQLPPSKTGKRVVGVKGRSGRKSAAKAMTEIVGATLQSTAGPLTDSNS